jgi:hypothetical protein
MLPDGVVGDLVDEYMRMSRPHALARCTNSAERWLQRSTKFTNESKIVKPIYRLEEEKCRMFAK